MYYTIHPDTQPGEYYFCIYGKLAECVYTSTNYESKEAAEVAAQRYAESWKRNNL